MGAGRSTDIGVQILKRRLQVCLVCVYWTRSSSISFGIWHLQRVSCYLYGTSMLQLSTLSTRKKRAIRPVTEQSSLSSLALLAPLSSFTLFCVLLSQPGRHQNLMLVELNFFHVNSSLYKALYRSMRRKRLQMKSPMLQEDVWGKAIIRFSTHNSLNFIGNGD